MPIHFFLCFNRQGKVRLSKWYGNYTTDEKRKLGVEIHKTLVSRPKGYTNFVDFHDDKLIYRRYAGLYFCVGVDRTANELAMLELVHLYVEGLDQIFENVCELDMVFNFFTCIQLWDEMVLGGEPVETSRKQLLVRMQQLKYLMKDGKQKNVRNV